MSKIKVYKKYGVLIDLILDEIQSENRVYDKKRIHSELKKSYGIESLKSLPIEELLDFVSEVEVFVHHHLSIEYKPNNSLSELLKQTNKEYEQNI